LTPNFAPFAAEIQDLKRVHAFRERRVPAPNLINFASNDYLGMRTNPEVIEETIKLIQQFGVGAGSSPLVTGWHPIHEKLENTLASWFGSAAALTFPSGYQTNVAVITSIFGAQDLILSDQFNHASIIDGCRLSRAEVQVYRHCDVEHLRQLLHQHGSDRRRIGIVTDSVFSMDGDIAPFRDLAEVAREFGAFLIVDEAHATGVIGEQGRGCLFDAGLVQPWIIKLGTLSKAIGSQGGFVVGTQSLIDLVINKGRGYIYSTALSIANAAAASHAILTIPRRPDLQIQIQLLRQLLVQGLSEIGYPLPDSFRQPGSAIIPIIIGSNEDALRISQPLETRGFLVPAIRPPTVPVGTARLRIALSVNHSEQDITQLVVALKECEIHRYAKS
jgi:8-amino-7-oxononanoate synthase